MKSSNDRYSSIPLKLISTEPRRFIHLLYVPTVYCNLGCHYCYLGRLTESQTLKADNERAESTLKDALTLFDQENILPFNLSLHGGEVTTIAEDTMSSLLKIINNHYSDNYDELMAAGFKKQSPHIKTNLFNFDRYLQLFNRHKVSISGSVDLPLSLHEKYRTTKSDKPSLPKIKKNIALLGAYTHGAKLSATLFKEHVARVDEIIDDIWYMHNELGFDMNNFNFMFGFESCLNDEMNAENNTVAVQAASEKEQVEFYNRMKAEFADSELAWGFKRNWFDEFTTSYCTNATNCGERFFLLQSNGDVYSCVRGQGSEGFYFGNIYKNSAKEILENGKSKISISHQESSLHEDCIKCDYLKICNTGCAFVKKQQGIGKSYSCKLQQQIYKDYPKQYPVVKQGPEKQVALKNYVSEVHPQHAINDTANGLLENEIKLSTDFYHSSNTLQSIIDNDAILQRLYSKDSIEISVNGDSEFLISQILRSTRETLLIEKSDCVEVHIRKDMFEVYCNDPKTNSLHIQFLRDTKVVYGDEQREKQEHIQTLQVYMNQLQPSPKGDDWLMLDLSRWLRVWSSEFIENVSNNIFFTTASLREYHYKKHQKNAFYHVQAINLPFQNLEFIWLK